MKIDIDRNTWKVIGVIILITALIAGGLTYLLMDKDENIVIIDGIRKVSKLATVEYTESTYENSTFESSLDPLGLFNVKSGSATVFVTGKVTGSVNLENAEIKISEDQVRILFGRNSVHISNVEVIYSKSFTCTTNFIFDPPTTGQISGLIEEAKTNILETAMNDGIVDKTKDYAREILTDFIGTFGYEVVIEFDDNAYDPEE